MPSLRTGLILFGLAALTALAALPETPSAYTAAVWKWRREREARLRSDTGWLTIAGLYWLKPGRQTIGSDPGNTIRLPGAAPAHLGVIELRGETVVLHYATPGKASVVLQPDTSGTATRIHLGPLTFWVIQRGNRFGIRLRDQNSRFRREFTGCRWYPVEPAYRVTARFIRAPKGLEVPSVIGVTTAEESPGYFEFRLGGKTLRLRPSGSLDSLELMFRDATSGQTTYGGGRFLPVPPVKNGKVVLDFNKAYNPPCAFIPYATCPVPIRENRLPVPIPAGERIPTRHTH